SPLPCPAVRLRGRSEPNLSCTKGPTKSEYVAPAPGTPAEPHAAGRCAPGHLLMPNEPSRCSGSPQLLVEASGWPQALDSAQDNRVPGPPMPVAVQLQFAEPPWVANWKNPSRWPELRALTRAENPHNGAA